MVCKKNYFWFMIYVFIIFEYVVYVYVKIVGFFVLVLVG